MSGTAAGGGRPPGRRGPDPEQALDRLRGLLIEPELAPERMARVLPEAVAVADEERGEELAMALEPAVTHAFAGVIRRDSGAIGVLLAPAIGAAVRRAVSEALRTMVERLNVIVERTFSLRGLGWRLEAARTGRPMAEVALLRSLRFRVEQVFLIHASTSLLLEHVQAPPQGGDALPSGSPDPDQVAALMGAIDAFARDAFRVADRGTHLGQFELGEQICWVEWGPQLMVAAVVRGQAPRSFGELLRQTLERLHLELREELTRFRSDVTPFRRARPALEQCLVSQARPPSRMGGWLLMGLVLLATAALSFWGQHALAERQRLAALVGAVRAAPGLVVVQAERRGSHYRLTGLRDPLAEDPVQLLARHGIAHATLHFQPFQSLHPAIVQARARRVLAPPPGVQLQLEQGVLRLSGTAPRDWIARTRLLATALPGIQSIDVAGLREAERPELWRELRQRARQLSEVEIPFPVGSTRVSGQRDALALAAARVAAYQRAAAALRVGTCVIAHGESDATGQETRNRRLSQARARTVADALGALGVAPSGLATEIRSPSGPQPGGRPPGRRVTFEVRQGQPGGPDGVPPCGGSR